MAQELLYPTVSNTTRKLLSAKNEAVAVAQSGDTTLLDMNVNGLDRVFIQLAVANQALDTFVVQVAGHPDAALVNIASAAGDYTSPTGLMLKASGDLTILAAAGTGWFLLDARGISRLKILASSANVAGSAVSIYAGGK